jgi:predicted dinucleotide-binding enzyme
MRIGIIGSGAVAQALAGGFLKYGHEVTLGTRHPDTRREWQTTHPKARVGSFADTAQSAEVVVLSVKGSAASDALRQAGINNLAGKVVIDTTNPIANAPPDHGVLAFFTSLEESLMERLQRECAAARFVKAFNSVGADLMVNPQLKGGPPTMFICGNDDVAKQVVQGILDQFGCAFPDFSATSGRTPSGCFAEAIDRFYLSGCSRRSAR